MKSYTSVEFFQQINKVKNNRDSKSGIKISMIFLKYLCRKQESKEKYASRNDKQDRDRKEE